ncbi:MAG: prepilin-type N-terminal cleavage/methylation domain-containing protein, partial [Planctomycetota bacterium]
MSRRRRGVTLVEAVLSMVVVSVLLVSALNAATSVSRGRQINEYQARALPLAEAMMAEILAKPYADPDIEVTVLGIDATETLGGRATYDDIDDYSNWFASPPEDAAGDPIQSFDAWGRSVTVTYVNPDEPSTPRVSDSGVKRVVVSVTRNGREVATLTALRTAAWKEADRDSGGGPVEPVPAKLVLIVDDAGKLSNSDTELQTLAADKEYDVEIIEDSDARLSDLDGADVVYISPKVTQGDLASDLPNTTTGVVIGEDSVYDF